VVTAGDTLVLPLEVTVTIEVMVTVSALETLQLRVELSPRLIVEGEAEKLRTIGRLSHPLINTETAIIQNKTKILL
jgi:hypothetical protein